MIPLVDLKAGFKPIKKEVFAAINQILDSMQLFLGPNVAAFEKEFAKFLKVKHAIACSNGTDALILALKACGVGPGDEVITTPLTFFATVEAIIHVGATPVFVDVDPENYLMDARIVEKKIGKKTKAIIPVHIYGQAVDLGSLMRLKRKYRLKIIEDAAQAQGTEYKGKKAGTIGDVGTFSFYFVKNLGAYGEAGCVVTNNANIAKTVRILRSHGEEPKNVHKLVGYNFRPDEIQAAILRIKLKRLNQYNSARRKNASLYSKLLKDLPIKLPTEPSWSKSDYHLYVIRTTKRDQLREFLTKKEIGVGIHYPVPCHLQPALKKYRFQKGSLPIAEKVCREILSLPMYPELREAQIKTVVRTIGEFFALNR